MGQNNRWHIVAPFDLSSDIVRHDKVILVAHLALHCLGHINLLRYNLLKGKHLGAAEDFVFEFVHEKLGVE